MSTFTKVLLATDLTSQSDNLTQCLFSLCPDTETEVVLAHVFEDDDDADPDGSNYKKASSRLDGYKHDLEQAGYEDVTIVTPVGEPSEVLHDQADALEADLMMVASHNKNFFERAFMGSTTLAMAKSTTTPLFIYKDEEEKGPGHGLLDTVLVATDFSKKSLEALNLIRSLREYVGRVLFVHVIERGSRSKQDYKEKLKNANLFLQELVDELKIFGIEASFIVSRGVASRQIDAICEAEKVSLIMMAKTGLDLNNSFDLGSTAENVVLNVDCPILLLPAEEIDE